MNNDLDGLKLDINKNYRNRLIIQKQRKIILSELCYEK